MKKYFTLLLIFAATILCAQDFHLSHYDATPQYLNPALTGMNYEDKSDYRINANYRSQWKSFLPKPYTTIGIGGDIPHKRFGLGAFLIANRTGVGNINALNAHLSAAYRITNDPSGKHNLSVGLQLGIIQKSFNPSQLTFDNQYSVDKGGFDTQISNGESFSKTNVVNFDAGIGISYVKRDSNQVVNAFGGFSIFHVNKPNESFTSQEYKLPMRFVLYGGINIEINEKCIVAPNILLMYQAQANEISPGAMIYYNIKEPYFLIAGLNYRNKDAIILHLGLKHKSNVYRLSYDINSSSLRSYSGNRGAIEFSVIYNGKKTTKKATPQI
jgi:type IX secretion system PorP/SprF family membrane protein